MALREAATVDAGSLRVEGARGFLLFRGAPDATAYAIAMSKERGDWKVGMMAPIALG